MHEDAKWHWGEGIKYALEAIKTLFIINGAAAVSVLTFIGNTKAHYLSLILSMVCFAFGVITGVATQICAYLTQLHYGNASQVIPPGLPLEHNWAKASRYHNLTYGFAIAGVVLFVVGVLFAAVGLYAFDSK